MLEVVREPIEVVWQYRLQYHLHHELLEVILEPFEEEVAVLGIVV